VSAWETTAEWLTRQRLRAIKGRRKVERIAHLVGRLEHRHIMDNTMPREPDDDMMSRTKTATPNQTKTSEPAVVREPTNSPHAPQLRPER